ncbi:hypothetical protein [Tropicibacter naphthalenivorans]|uniref:Uncharacterized protein n=1 Tax=Tropicibacter naphthalenivorans TaxID=441103 RepID=A0A0P1H0H6_9RHOB|nr:hypothetical protein [Tropicibacter naphthalenivorans]CUH82375.1 hypothetical protein TRN7648_03937 [Tropicibacter naphthalenivorans]SMD05446.1 hypothetical protein SAMN04488093_1137 [Tropicibacter naphthalenivorans]
MNQYAPGFTSDAASFPFQEYLQKPESTFAQSVDYITIPAEIALYTRAPAHGVGAAIGSPFEFILKPAEDVWDDLFDRMARPSEMSIRTGAAGLIAPKARRSQGAWMVRHSDDWTFLTNMNSGQSPTKAGGTQTKRAEDRAIFVEQCTVRFARKDWALHAPELFAQARTWITGSAAWHCRMGIPVVPEFTVSIPKGQDVEQDLEPLMPASKIPSRLLDDDELDAPISPILTLLERYSPDERAHFRLASGFTRRIPGMTVQFYEAGMTSLGRALETAGFSLPSETDPNCNDLRSKLAETQVYQPDQSVQQLMARVRLKLPQVAAEAEPVLTSLSLLPTLGSDALEQFSGKSLVSAIILLDCAYAMTFSNRDLLRDVFKLYSGALLALLRRSILLDLADLRAISWLEFAPILLGSFPQKEQGADGDAVWANMTVARELDEATYDRMCLRMDLPSDGLYRDWTHAMSSSYARYAWTRSLERWESKSHLSSLRIAGHG